MQAWLAEAREIVDANCFWLTSNHKDLVGKLFHASEFVGSVFVVQHWDKHDTTLPDSMAVPLA
jgi:hypothetical protein